MSEGLLDAHQHAAAMRLLTEESRHREHVVVALSGAHAYGFPSADSDVDLKAVHVEPTHAIVGLRTPAPSRSRIERVDDVEIDYSSNEIRQVLAGVLKGDGNFIERILGGCTLVAGADLAELQLLVRGALSRRLYHHYRGFATAQLKGAKKDSCAGVKALLYVLRTALTGEHALLTGEIVTDVGVLLDGELAAFRPLMALKVAREAASLDARESAAWLARVGTVFDRLDRALERSALPESATNEAEIDAWLREARRRRW